MTAPLVDEGRLTTWLYERFEPRNAIQVSRHQAGHSNETFFLLVGRRELVLRRPPAGAFLPTAHDVLREYRVLEALEGRGTRAPRAVAACEDESVIGAPFYLAERARGHVVRDVLPDALRAREARERIGDEMVDALAEIHAVEWRGSALAKLGKPDGYLERQVRRWSGQMELTLPHTHASRPVPELAEVGAWLASHVPATPRTTLVHGDFKLDNVMLDDEGRVVAVLDWEMSTLGDPLADLGWLVSFWREAGDPEPELPVASRVTELPGFRSRREMIARYEARSGLEARHLAFYEALAVWKLAILLEGSYARHLLGATDDPLFPLLKDGVPLLARRALGITKRGDGA